MKVTELLLKADTGKLDLPKKEVEIPRLTKLFGSPVIFTVQALAPSKYEEIQQSGVTINQNGGVTMDNGKMQKLGVLAGVIDPSFKDPELKKHYNAATPEEVMNKLLLPGEIVTLFTVITDISGFRMDAVQEVKN